jgi:hypothetical protein
VLKSIRKIEPLVNQVLPTPLKQHQKIQRFQTIKEVENLFPGFEAFIDATKQRCQDLKTSVNVKLTTVAKETSLRKNPINSQQTRFNCT